MSRRADADKVPPSKLGSTADVEEADMMMPSTSARGTLRAPAAQWSGRRRCLLAVIGLSIAASGFLVRLCAWSPSPSTVPGELPVHVSFPDRKQCELAALYTPAQGRDGGWRRGDANGLAMRESGGFFDEPEELWRLRRMRHIQQRCRQAESLRACPAPAWRKDCWPACRGASPARCPSRSFWQIHYEPTFSCDAELRIGLPA
uniref:Uncharacterized protein n=1 Tax=Alexandrium monilatum TaxID=311494 RepID=A0A7S4T4J4_9DINO